MKTISKRLHPLTKIYNLKRKTTSKYPHSNFHRKLRILLIIKLNETPYKKNPLSLILLRNFERFKLKWQTVMSISKKPKHSYQRGASNR